MRSIVVLALLAACSHSDAPPPKTAAAPPPAAASAPADSAARPAAITDDMVASADHVVGVLTSTFDDVAAAGKDCKAVAAALRKHLEPMKAIAPEANKLEDIKDPEARKWFENKYGAKLAEGNQKMQGAMACKEDTDVQAAMGELKTAMAAH
jgi:hypothetical protein